MAATKVIGVRVPVALAEAWEARAQAAGMSVGALIIQRMERRDEPNPRTAVASSPLPPAVRASLRRTMSRPILKAPDAPSDKPVAAVLPVVGTEFPRQLTWWEKEQVRKGKGKP